MEVNWLFFSTVVVFTYLLFAVVIPFGWALGYSCKWNIWIKNIAKLNQDQSSETNKKEKPHVNPQDNGAKRKQ